MTYTSNFGTTPYTKPDGSVVEVPDLTKFATIPSKFRSPTYSLSYRIKDGERLDQIAKRIYGQEDRLWIIILLNNMVNLSESWPLNDEEFSYMLGMKYPFHNPSDTHHYEDIDGNVVDPFVGALRADIPVEAFVVKENLTPVTILQYETRLNDAKRNIKVLDPSLVDRLEDSMFAAFDNPERR